MSINPEKSLQRLIQTMQPSLMEGTYAYVTVPNGRAMPPGLSPLMTFREPEGVSLLVTEREAAFSGLPAAFFCRGILLNLNASLYAVGFLAAVAARLAKAGMSINIVSAYHRDYIFVPSARAEEAVGILKKMALE